jgi:hypothetical protein
MRFLYTLFKEAIYFREDPWFHYGDGKTYEMRSSEKLELLGYLLKEMSENKGGIK